MTDLLGIGELAQASGLTVSALRFYDTHAVLVPAVVDERTGYRRYAVDQVVAARVIAGLRRIGLPVAEMPAVLERLDDAEQVAGILHAHLTHLEAGVAGARLEVARLLRLLGSDDDVPGVPVLPPQPELRFPASGFEHALRRVEFAVATHDEAGALGGIHLRAAGGVCTWVATDRYRLATTTCPVSQADWEATLAPALLRQALEDQVDGEVRLRADLPTVDGDYPDVERLRTYLGQGRHRVLDRAALAELLVDAEPGQVRLEHLLLDGELFQEAVEALPGDQLMLELDGPLAPIALRDPQDGSTWTLLMPIRDDTIAAEPSREGA